VFMYCLKLIVLFVISSSAIASPVIIYGEDSRIDTFECSNPLFQELARSTAAQVHVSNLKIRGNGTELRGKSLGEMFRLCEKERFFHQPFVANCSGFLVAPDIIVSAGHCFESKDQCSQYHWVFDYKLDHENQRHVTVSNNNVYKCKEILDQKLTDSLDYAIVRLDREVKDRAPVKIASDVKIGTSVVMVGHPSGLPQKIADDAKILSVSTTEFKANVDAFQINSGSAVFNAKNGELLGILVRGKMDYRTNQQWKCTEVNETHQDDGGEDIASYKQFEKSLKTYLK
jgi:hypothetical protein